MRRVNCPPASTRPAPALAGIERFAPELGGVGETRPTNVDLAPSGSGLV